MIRNYEFFSLMYNTRGFERKRLERKSKILFCTLRDNRRTFTRVKSTTRDYLPYLNMNIPNIDCIGEVSSQQLLWLTWFSQEWETHISAFDDKVIVDFWAGVSDFLYTVSQISNPARLIAIDPMYENQDVFDEHVARTIWFMKERISEVMKIIDETPSRLHINILTDLQRRFKLLNAASYSDTCWVERRITIEDKTFVKACDYIFVTNTFFYFKNKEALLAILWLMLKDDGKIIITDYIHDNNGTGSAIEFFRKELEKGTPGIRGLSMNDHNASIEITRNGAATPLLAL